MKSMFNSDASLPYNHHLFESPILKKTIKVDGEAGYNYSQMAQNEFTDRKIRGSNPTSTSLFLSGIGQPSRFLQVARQLDIRGHDISVQNRCYNYDLFERFIVKKRTNVDGEGAWCYLTTIILWCIHLQTLIQAVFVETNEKNATEIS
ncbi:hypothetical protein T265_08506 [Opisthorchis viverrini]|uniref:Uncharacterized protein n=1 Tax=Opisthorchis viverrini TaxID=6198 RepID=A0A074Z8Z5_OPIVI|nr:hypothetical protein T265_08506 [Opisthorchis viverrini]KER23651.1 hypothetical protein T265_08506 [Opisthorchis viverrini]